MKSKTFEDVIEIYENPIGYIKFRLGKDNKKLAPKWIPKVDLNFYLQSREMGWASYTILSGLIKNIERQLIINNVFEEYFWDKSFEKYLFKIIKNQINKNGEINISELFDHIKKFGVEVYGVELTKPSIKEDYFKFAQILDLNPSEDQIKKAIELRIMWAKHEGVLKES